jgi:hypothetical protein
VKKAYEFLRYGRTPVNQGRFLGAQNFCPF